MTRTISPTITSTAEARKGTRQPQLMNASSPKRFIRLKAPVDNNAPTEEPSWANEPKKEALPRGAFSTAMSTAPPHSPPIAMPWIRRSTISRIGASAPTWAYVGSRPMAKDATPIITSVMTRVFLRPTRSPMCPKTMPPSGRSRKPMAKVAKADRVLRYGDMSGGKNTSLKTIAAAVANA